MPKPGPLKFMEQYDERLWGGQSFRTLYGKPIPPDRPIAEAWLISDHPGDESVVAVGPHQGRTLHDVMLDDVEGLLGRRVSPTIHGRFPLLLKLLDARVTLSVQVHPDDETARRLGEPDVGKTEMWYVLHREPGAELICGLNPALDRDAFSKLLGSPAIEDTMMRFRVEEGDAMFVPAGTVHAIGSGLVLAEIQQNSDLTYRLYDWGRVERNGMPRELHLDKAMEAITFGSVHLGPATPLAYGRDGLRHSVLAACPYFAAEFIEAPEKHTVVNDGSSFHILLAPKDTLHVASDDEGYEIRAGEAVLLPANLTRYEVGRGGYLKYYVPDWVSDVEVPLLEAGHDTRSIQRLRGR